MQVNRRPILVTGMHRSGTTFVGRVLSLPRNIVYIQEPLNKSEGCQGVPCWYPYPDSACGYKVKELIPKIDLNCSYKVKHYKNDSIFKRFIKTYLSSRAGLYMKYAKLRSLLPGFRNFRTLIKDPLALLMSEWMANEFNMQVVVIVRHPAAIYYSLKRLGWRFDFKNLLEQKEFMEKYGSDLLNKLSATNLSLIKEVGYLWVLLHRAIQDFKRRNSGWYLVRHEDICERSLEVFKGMYDYLGIPYKDGIKNKINNLTSAKKVEAQNNSVHDFKRNSKRLARYWENKLSLREIKELRKICEDEMLGLYDEW